MTPCQTHRQLESVRVRRPPPVGALLEQRHSGVAAARLGSGQTDAERRGGVLSSRRGHLSVGIRLFFQPGGGGVPAKGSHLRGVPGDSKDRVLKRKI